MATFAVGCLQIDGGGERALARLTAQIVALKRRFSWLDMIVLPELCTYGAGIESAEPEDGTAERAYREVARDNQVWLVPGSLYQRVGGKVFNAAPVIDPAGATVARCRKLFPFRPYEEGIAPGDACCTFPLPGVGVFGVSICYDLWFPEVTRSLAWLGAEVVIVPTLTNTIDRDVELAMARANAASNQCYVISVNAAAPTGMGRSIVCGPGGEVIHEAGAGTEPFAVELDLDYVARVRRRGWHGLGQPLKSFRDCTVRFPAYEEQAKSTALDALGPIGKPAPR